MTKGSYSNLLSLLDYQHSGYIIVSNPMKNLSQWNMVYGSTSITVSYYIIELVI